MTQTDQLINYIKVCQYATYEQVEAEAKKINPEWRSETWRRSLRRRKDIKAVHKNNNPLEPIIGYEAVILHSPIILKQVSFL